MKNTKLKIRKFKTLQDLCIDLRIATKDYPPSEAMYADIYEFEEKTKLKFPWDCIA